MRTFFCVACLLVYLGLVACAQGETAVPTVTTIPTQTSAAAIPPTAVPLELPPPATPTTAVIDTPVITPTLAAPLPSLTEPGPYSVGFRELTFTDARRAERKIRVWLYYPAIWAGENAVPDYSGAPYPLILYSPSPADIPVSRTRVDLEYLTTHLASHGFVVTAVMYQDNWTGIELTVDGPRDILLALDHLTRLDSGDLAGLMDTQQAGVAGYYFGGYVALSLAGARLDPTYRTAWCREPAHHYDLVCLSAAELEQRAAYHAQFVTPPEEGELWPPFSDERIQAVFSLGGGGGPVFGERGLAAATVPTLIIEGTNGADSPYAWSAVFVYENLGAEERYLISVPGVSTTFAGIYGSRYQPAVLTLATAFFGRYLQQQEAYASYLTEEYVNDLDGVVWGVYDPETNMPTWTPTATESTTWPLLTAVQSITPGNVNQIQQLAAFDQDTICRAVFSPDGKLLAASTINGITLWDMVDGKIIHTLSTGYQYISRAFVSFSPNTALIAAAVATSTCAETNVRVWDLASGELLLQRLDDSEHMATGVALHPAGTMVAAGTGCAFNVPGSASVIVWEIASGTLLLDIPLTSFVFDVAFSPDGRLLAAVTADGSITLWDVATGVLHAELNGNRDEEWGWSIAFSPDGTKLASGGVDVRLWDVASGAQLFLFEAPVGGAMDVAFSPDGRLLVAGGGSQALMFWDTATGATLPVQGAANQSDNIQSVAFNSDSTLLATCGHDEMLRLWGVPTPPANN